LSCRERPGSKKAGLELEAFERPIKENIVTTAERAAENLRALAGFPSGSIIFG
jgi:hypothetical protein